MADTNFRWRWRRWLLRCFVLAAGLGELRLVGGRAVLGKRKMDNNAAEARLRRAAASGGKHAANAPIHHADEIERSSKRRRRVSLPPARPNQPARLRSTMPRSSRSFLFPAVSRSEE